MTSGGGTAPHSGAGDTVRSALGTEGVHENETAVREEWAQRFVHQGRACGELGSPLWQRLLTLIGRDVRAAGPSWDVLGHGASLRFGQGALPLRGFADLGLWNVTPTA